MKHANLIGIMGIFVFVALVSSPLTAGLIQPLGNSGWSYEVSEAYQGNVSIAMDPGSNGDYLIIELRKEFTSPVFKLGTQGESIWVDFVKTGQNATKNIIIFDERIINRTGVVWKDFHIGLVQNSVPLNREGAYVGFNDNVGFEKVDGLNPFTMEYSSFDGVNGAPTWMNFTDGEVPAGGAELLLGVNGSANNYAQIMVDTDKMLTGEIFSLKEYPTIPEPATIGLLSIGALALIKRRKKQLQ